MTNKPHPPLCPGRKKGYSYHSGRLCYHDHIGLLLDSENQDDREFICRDQACAWLDRAKKLHRLYEKWWDTHTKFNTRGPEMREAGFQAEFNAKAWREWERG